MRSLKILCLLFSITVFGTTSTLAVDRSDTQSLHIETRYIWPGGLKRKESLHRKTRLSCNSVNRQCFWSRFLP